MLVAPNIGKNRLGWLVFPMVGMAFLVIYIQAMRWGALDLQIIAALLPLALVYLLVCMTRPAVGISLAIVSVPLQRGLLGDLGLAITWAMVGLALVGVLLGDKEWSQRLRLRLSLPLVLAVVLTIYILFSLYLLNAVAVTGRWLVLPWRDAEGAPQMLMISHTMAFLALLVVASTSSIFFDVALKAVIVSLVIVVGTALYEWISVSLGVPSLISVMYGWNYGATSTPPEPAAQAAPVLGGIFVGWVGNAQLSNTVITLACIALPVLYLSSRRSRRLAFLLLGTGGFVIYSTFSLANWLGVVVAVLVLWLLLYRNKGFSAYLFATVVTGLVLFLSVPQPWAIPKFPRDVDNKIKAALSAVTGRGDAQNASVTVRQEFNRVGMGMFLQNPLVGTGYGTLGRYLTPESNPGRAAGGEGVRYPHNSYMQILGQLGLLGMLMFGAIVVISARSLLTVFHHVHSDRTRALSAGLLAALAGNLVFFFAYASWSYNVNFWLIIALAIGLRHIHQASTETLLSPARPGRHYTETAAWAPD